MDNAGQLVKDVIKAVLYMIFVWPFKKVLEFMGKSN